jgi:hypothetical protein
LQFEEKGNRSVTPGEACVWEGEQAETDETPNKPPGDVMKRYLRIPVLLACVMAVGCSARQREFTSSEGRFRVLMPGTPTEQPEGEDTFAGPASGKRFLAVVGTPETERYRGYGVSYIDYPERYIRSMSAEKIFKEQKDSVVPSDGSLVQERTMTISGHRGFELEVAWHDGKTVVFHMYLVEQRLYMVVAKYPGGTRPPEVDAFFNSFQLTSG